MRVYNRPMSGGSWNTLEEYLDAPTVRWYGAGANSYIDYSLLAGHWLSSLNPPPDGEMLHQDWFGVQVRNDMRSSNVGAPVRTPEYLVHTSELPTFFMSMSMMNERDPCEGKKKVAKCQQTTCCTDVETDMATCCPDGRAYCGPVEGYTTACGNPTPSPQPPKPEPPSKPSPGEPSFNWLRCAVCILNCLLAGGSGEKCWRKCVEKGDCGLQLPKNSGFVGYDGRRLYFGVSLTF